MTAIKTNQPCSDCGSSDALAVYENGTYCFSCDRYRHHSAEDQSSISEYSSKHLELDGFTDYKIKPLTKRGISVQTCQKWKVYTGSYKGERMLSFPNYLNGELDSVKLRDKQKNFKKYQIGSKKPLYGQWLWKEGGKMITITEGEIDALTVSQLFDNKWPVVSINDGASSAEKTVARNLEYLLTFDKVVILFDSDEPGRKASEKVAKLFPYGKANVASLPMKDPNEMLLAGRGAEVVRCIWEAKPYKPEGIVQGNELKTRIEELTAATKSYKYPYESLNLKTFGIRKGELVTLTAGSGLGKSTLSREIAYDLAINQNVRLAYVALEESILMTMIAFISIHFNKSYHLELNDLTSGEIWELWEQLPETRHNIIFFDHFGSLETKTLLEKFRFLALGADCEFIFLDHLSIVVSGQADGDERRNIDLTMTQLKTLTENVNVGIFMVSHLKDSQGGKAYEEGGQTHLNGLRGSRSIGQLSNIVIGLERNQQAEDESDRNVMDVRILKNRFSGLTGLSGKLRYVLKTNRIHEASSGDQASMDDLFDSEGNDDEF